MKFSEDLFPLDIAYGAEFSREYSTTISTSGNGKEQRNINWLYSRAIYNISYGIKTYDQAKKLIDFFHSKRGKAIGFRFRDFSDYSAKNQLLAIGDNITRSFKLIKTYGKGNIKKIHKPVEGSIKIYLDGIETKDFSVDYTKGIITFPEAIGKSVKITADFEFDIPVRFDSDRLSAIIHSDNAFEIGDINLIELKL